MKTIHCLAVVVLVAANVGAQCAALELPGVGGATYSVKVTSLREARFKTTTRQQYDFSCGSAALATLLTHHYGNPVTEKLVFEEMFAKGQPERIRREGFSLLDMKNYLNAHQFQADGFALPLDKLLESGLPAIVLIAERKYHHFVVIKGLRDGRVLIGDPSSGTRAMSREQFEPIWVNKLLFVIHNRQKQAQFNSEADWRAAPRAPLGDGVNRSSLSASVIPKLGPGDF